MAMMMVVPPQCSSISSIPCDVIHTHILTRLDGPTLASAGCVSSHIHSLSKEETLWRDICLSTWPSLSHPSMQKLISDFPNGGPRSFFSNSFPLLLSPPSPIPPSPSLSPQHIISAVDIRYKDKLIFSKVQETETKSRWFSCSPFRIDMLEPKQILPTPLLQLDEHDKYYDELTLSWIIIFDGGQKAAANLSSWRPVSVEKHEVTKDIRVRFSTILRVKQSELDVECGITVTFEGEEMMELYEVSLHLEDINRISLKGNDCLRILHRAVETRERRKGRREEVRERYEEFLRKRQNNNWRLDSLAHIISFIHASFSNSLRLLVQIIHVYF